MDIKLSPYYIDVMAFYEPSIILQSIIKLHTDNDKQFCCIYKIEFY